MGKFTAKELEELRKSGNIAREAFYVRDGGRQVVFDAGEYGTKTVDTSIGPWNLGTIEQVSVGSRGNRPLELDSKLYVARFVAKETFTAPNGRTVEKGTAKWFCSNKKFA